MAINDYTNFDFNIEQVTKPVDLNIKRQEKVMNSEYFNSSLQSIEKNLDILYEKTRYLEDAIDYASTFLDQKITAFDTKISSIINSVQDITSVNKNMAYLEFPVPFQKNVVDSTDRNKDYRVEPCDLNEASKVLTISAHDNTSYTLSSINRIGECIPYDSNIDKFLEGEKYRAIYIEDKIQKNGLVETFSCHFPHAIEVNNINIKPTNSEVTNTTLVYPNGVTELLDDEITGINFSTRMITHFTFTLSTKNYNVVEYILDKEMSKADNIWDNIKQYEHSLAYGSDTKVEVEAMIKRTLRSKGGKELESRTYREAEGATVKVVKYIYILGIDSILVNLMKMNKDCYFLSETINLGRFTADDYLQISVKDNIGEFSTIEYYIVDGSMEIPILPIGEKYVYNERIFPENNLRFTVDTKYYSDGVFKIKKDGMSIESTFDNVSDQYDAIYSASYQPVDTVYSYTPINDSIKIKAIVRLYGETIDTIPYIQSISIRKYGGNTLWTQVY